MPNFADAPPDSSPVKMLLIGDSGSGKTGSLASLVRAGYTVGIIDMDNGVQILQQILKDDPIEVKKRLYWETFTDKMQVVEGVVKYEGKPMAAANAAKALDTFPGLGKVSSLDQSHVIVLDSLTLFSDAVRDRIFSVVNRLPPSGTPQIQDWGAAINAVEQTLGLIYSSHIKCHFIITSHIAYVQSEIEELRAYPSTLGTKLPPKVGRYFNTMLHCKVVGGGAATKRIISTVPAGNLGVKTPNPKAVKKEYSIETGLAEFFSDLGYVPPSGKGTKS